MVKVCGQNLRNGCIAANYQLIDDESTGGMRIPYWESQGHGWWIHAGGMVIPPVDEESTMVSAKNYQRMDANSDQQDKNAWKMDELMPPIQS
jgi:hypothetical protein